MPSFYGDQASKAQMGALGKLLAEGRITQAQYDAEAAKISGWAANHVDSGGGPQGKYILGAIGGVAGALGGPAGVAAGASLGYGAGQAMEADSKAAAAAKNTFTATPGQVDPTVGIGQGSFGLTPAEQAVQQQRQAQTDQLNGQYAAMQKELQAFQDNWKATHNGDMSGFPTDPAFQELLQRSNSINNQLSYLHENPLATPDMSDPGRFAAMSETAQGRAGVTMQRFGTTKAAGPEIYEMQRQAAPAVQEMNRFGVNKFNVNEFDIDPNAGAQDYANYQATRAKNLQVMNAVEDRALGRGGPSVAELQLAKGQDRAISQQAALAASGGQMDYAVARRQAMLGAADISQKTAADQAILRANEQIGAQQTFGSMNAQQQSADQQARAATMGQANARAGFLSGQALNIGQFNAQQAQYEASLLAQQERDAVASRVGQMQFGATLGFNQEKAIADSMAQQRQWNAQFGVQQDQWGAGFQAQQELSQAGLTMQQRQQNDAYQQMLLNQYMQSRGMQQQTAFNNQNAQLQAAGVNANLSIANQNAQMQNANAQRQQGTALMQGGATMLASGMSSGAFNSAPPPPATARDAYGNTITQGANGYIAGAPPPTYVPPPNKVG